MIKNNEKIFPLLNIPLLNISLLNILLEIFHCLIFHCFIFHCLIFHWYIPIFAGSCCNNCGRFYAKVSSSQYTVFGNRLSISLRFLIVYGVFVRLNISFIIDGDKPYRNLKISIISC